MKESEIIALENTRSKQRETHKNKMDRLWRIQRLEHIIKKPKGILTHKCPQCNKKLTTERLECLTYFYCECGYEYVYYRSGSLNVY